MTLKLYGDILSPGVRAVLLTAKAIGTDLDVISIDIHKNEHCTPEFTEINPQQTIPTLDDNGFILWDGHAIMMYLVQKYGKGSTLYPADLQKQAHVNRILHFDTGDLFIAYCQVARVILEKKTNEVPKQPAEKLLKLYNLVELFLNRTTYIADDDLTIADFSIWTTLTNCAAFLPIDQTKYPKISAWIKNLESLPYQYLNREGGDKAKEVFDVLLRDNRVYTVFGKIKV